MYEVEFLEDDNISRLSKKIKKTLRKYGRYTLISLSQAMAQDICGDTVNVATIVFKPNKKVNI